MGRVYKITNRKRDHISKNFPVEETKKALYQLKNKKYFSLIKNKDHPLGELLDNENRKITGR